MSEQTTKKWKGVQGVGCLLSLIAITVMMVAFATRERGSLDQTAHTIAGAMGALLIGLMFYFVGRVGGWWNHG